MALAINREARQRREAEQQANPVSVHDRGYSGPRGAALERIRALQASPLPDRPCFKCGERGWCRHRPAPYV